MGVCNAIRTARMDMSPEEMAENVSDVLEGVVARLGGWSSVQSVHVKTSDSAALPVYHSVLSSKVDVGEVEE